MNNVWNKFHVHPSLHLLILVFVGYQALVLNISLSLFGETEGLYAIVTHTMMAAGDYVHLSLKSRILINLHYSFGCKPFSSMVWVGVKLCYGFNQLWRVSKRCWRPMVWGEYCFLQSPVFGRL
jgi:hypothetical protein